MTRELQRTIRALFLCCILLGSCFVVLLRVSSQPENPIDALLRLPAPPPPNPEAQFYGRSRPPEFYKSSNPPPDNAPIADLLEYWRSISADGSRLRYSPEPSDRTASRLLDEIQKDPKKLTELLNVLPKDERTGNLVKELFERNSEIGGYEKYEQTQIKRWLTYNTPHFSHELARSAQRSGADGESVRGEEDLLALTRVDFSKAEPIVDRLYLDSGNRVGQVLGTWARYRHALDASSTGDIERYRDELMRFVADRDASNRTRDLAMDALVLEKDWGGRDDWYYSLLGDTTLADLGGFTGLTTLILNSPDDKYIDKMLDLVKSDDPNVRSAAVRNLVLKIDSGRPEVIKALLPWLDDPKWAKDPGTVRLSLVRALRNIKVPESVSGLIKTLDEKGKRLYGNTSANAPADAASNIMFGNAGRISNSNRPSNTVDAQEVEYLQFRYDAIAALGTQEDIRAVPPLRRILNEPDSSAQTIIPALIKCKGFTVAEQVDGMDIAVRGREDSQARAEAASNAIAANAGYGWDSEYSLYGSNSVFSRTGRGPTSIEIKKMVGVQLMESTEVSDDLAAGVVDHIEMLDKREPKIARAFRDIVRRWQNSAINLLLLRDLKRGVANADSIVRLLAVRKKLQTDQSAAVHDIRTGTPTAIGIAACLLEDRPDYTVILDEAPVETKAAMLACSRLIRAELPLDKVAEATRSPDKRLVTAAELYAESEDSQAARTIVLSRHLGEARITGATTAFL